jgi:hypothetical protein
MDPYLEEPGLWPDVHTELLSGMRALLNAQLRPKYYARLEDRVYISDENDPGRRVIIPDVRVIAGSEERPRSGNPATAAVMEIAPLEVTTLIEDEIREPRVVVIDAADETVVTVIELLSPTNKIPGSRGRESYETKREEVMRSPTHFIEIDLLRAGEGFPPYEALPPHDYRVHLSRVSRRPRGLLWAIPMDRRLPNIPVPLRGNDPDATLELQRALDLAYERADYDLGINYKKPPPGAMSAERANWLDALLRERGLR